MVRRRTQLFSPQSSASQIQEGGAGELDVKQRVVGEGDKREGNQGGAGELDVKPGVVGEGDKGEGEGNQGGARELDANQGVVGEGDKGEGEGNQILTLDGEGESKHSSQQSQYAICTRIQ